MKKVAQEVMTCAGTTGPEYVRVSRGRTACGELMTLTFQRPTTVAICDTQPIVVEGIKSVLDGLDDLTFAWAAGTLKEGEDLLRLEPVSILVLDKTCGPPNVLDWVTQTCSGAGNVLPIVWANTMSEAEALRFLKAGCRGIVRKTTSIEALLSCVRAVATGHIWMEEALFRQTRRGAVYSRSVLTARERQVTELVRRGMKNKEIARELSISPGTVKIHMKHIFEKTGVRGRYNLALIGLKEQGLESSRTVPPDTAETVHHPVVCLRLP